MAGRRPNPPIIHMIVAMLVVLAPALLAVAWFQRTPPPTITAVDAAPPIAAARAAGLAVEAPVHLPEGWVCTRARWTPQGAPGVGGGPAPGNTLGLGFLSPQQLYFAVDIRDAAPDALVADVTRKGQPDGASAVAGRSWQRVRSPDGRTRALVSRDGERVTIVSADAGYEALEAFAGTLAAT